MARNVKEMVDAMPGSTFIKMFRETVNFGFLVRLMGPNLYCKIAFHSRLDMIFFKRKDAVKF